MAEATNISPIAWHALPAADEALELSVATGDRAGQTSALTVVGWYHSRLGDPEGARHAIDLTGLGAVFGQPT
jgi:hypothetical protein